VRRDDCAGAMKASSRHPPAGAGGGEGQAGLRPPRGSKFRRQNQAGSHTILASCDAQGRFLPSRCSPREPGSPKPLGTGPARYMNRSGCQRVQSIVRGGATMAFWCLPPLPLPRRRIAEAPAKTKIGTTRTVLELPATLIRSFQDERCSVARAPTSVQNFKLAEPRLRSKANNSGVPDFPASYAMQPPSL
jgi:hypothetical protein